MECGYNCGHRRNAAFAKKFAGRCLKLVFSIGNIERLRWSWGARWSWRVLTDVAHAQCRNSRSRNPRSALCWRKIRSQLIIVCVDESINYGAGLLQVLYFWFQLVSVAVSPYIEKTVIGIVWHTHILSTLFWSQVSVIVCKDTVCLLMSLLIRLSLLDLKIASYSMRFQDCHVRMNSF